MGCNLDMVGGGGVKSPPGVLNVQQSWSTTGENHPLFHLAAY